MGITWSTNKKKKKNKHVLDPHTNTKQSKHGFHLGKLVTLISDIPLCLATDYEMCVHVSCDINNSCSQEKKMPTTFKEMIKSM